MKIIGIDPGTAKMGYAIIDSIDKNNTKLLETDILVTSSKLEDGDRLRFLFNGLTELLKNYQPKVMVIERIFFNMNAKTAISVGQARGICMLAAANAKVKTIEYTALQAKKLLTGYGRATKKQMQEAVKDILKLPKIIKSDDANDAVAMALCYLKKELYAEGNFTKNK